MGSALSCDALGTVIRGVRSVAAVVFSKQGRLPWEQGGLDIFLAGGAR